MAMAQVIYLLEEHRYELELLLIGLHLPGTVNLKLKFLTNGMQLGHLSYVVAFVGLVLAHHLNQLLELMDYLIHVFGQLAVLLAHSLISMWAGLDQYVRAL
jgi:hypothetical protein